ALTASGPVFFLLILTIKLLGSHSVNNKDRRKKQNALNKSLSILKDSEKAARINPERARGKFCAGIKKYLGDRFNAVEAGMTPADAKKLFYKNNIDKELTARFINIFERNFNTEYTADRNSVHDLAEDCREACDTLRRIDKSLMRKTSACANLRRQGYGDPEATADKTADKK
ncbi:hypothetical protein ACFLS1_09880, partial [Verrucomicrobiota bacterium]